MANAALSSANPHPDWLNVHRDQLDQALTELIEEVRTYTGNDTIADLLLDAMSRGRMIRSTTALQWAHWHELSLGERGNKLIRPSSVYKALMRTEMMQAAACILDDEIDGDTLRRGIPTFATRHGRPQGILTSLLLLAKAFSGSRRTSAINLRAMIDMVVGESWDAYLMQTNEPIRGDTLLADYLKKSTASFDAAYKIIRMNVRPNTHHASGSPLRIRDGTYGAAVGALYQLTNDYYDTFGIDPLTRGQPDDRVLISLNGPLCFAIAEEPKRREQIGVSLQRKDLVAFYREILSDDVRRKTRARIDALKAEICDEFAGRPEPVRKEVAAMVDSIDSLLFWQYRYAA